MADNGPTLRQERRMAEVSATALAAHMGISRATLWTMEQAAIVAPERAAAHRTAVKALRDAKGEAVA